RSARARFACAAATAAACTGSSSSSLWPASSPCDRPPAGRFGTYLSPRWGSRRPMGLVTRFARQWVAGETRADAIRVAREANARGLDALVNHLGEHYREKGPVESTAREYLDL